MAEYDYAFVTQSYVIAKSREGAGGAGSNAESVQIIIDRSSFVFDAAAESTDVGNTASFTSSRQNLTGSTV